MRIEVAFVIKLSHYYNNLNGDAISFKIVDIVDDFVINSYKPSSLERHSQNEATSFFIVRGRHPFPP